MVNKNENTTDATRGSSLKLRVAARQQELEQALAKLGPDDRARVDIAQALTEITGLLTGDLDQKHPQKEHPGKQATIKH